MLDQHFKDSFEGVQSVATKDLTWKSIWYTTFLYSSVNIYQIWQSVMFLHVECVKSYKQLMQGGFLSSYGIDFQKNYLYESGH